MAKATSKPAEGEAASASAPQANVPEATAPITDQERKEYEDTIVKLVAENERLAAQMEGGSAPELVERRPCFVQPYPDWMIKKGYDKLHRDGFITIIVPETRDALGGQHLPVGAGDRLIHIPRAKAFAVPVRFVTRIENAVHTEIVKERRPIFNKRFTSKDEIPELQLPTESKEVRKPKYIITKTRPTDAEMEQAAVNFPADVRLAEDWKRRTA